MIRRPVQPNVIRALVLPLAGGALFPLSFAPFSLWAIAPCALLLLWYSLHQPAGKRRPFLHGFCFGVGTYGVGTSWIFVSIYYFGKVPLFSAVLVTAAFVCLLATTTGLATWLYAHITLRLTPHKKHDPLASASSPQMTIKHALFFTACWIAVEWSRTWFLSGFPWLFLGYASSNTVFSGFVPIVGVLGTGAIMLMSALFPASIIKNSPGLFDAFRHSPRDALRQATRLGIAASLPLALFLGGWGLAHKNWTNEVMPQALDVHLIQGNIPQSQKREPEYFPEHLAIYEKATQTLLEEFEQRRPQRPQLIVWPEAAIPVLLHNAWNTYNELDARAKKNNTAWISGVPWVEFQNKVPYFYNGVFAAGLGSGFYAKQRLVPFGESMPFPKFVRKLGPLFNLSPVGFSPGEAEQGPLYAQGMSISPFICYEIVFPSLVRHQAKEADILLTISNDGWFGHSFGPDQHFEIARMRALETGKMLLRVTNNGITAVIGKQGEVLAQLPRFEQGTLSQTVYPTIGRTPFMLWSHWPILAPALIFLALQVGKGFLGRKKKLAPNQQRSINCSRA